MPSQLRVTVYFLTETGEPDEHTAPISTALQGDPDVGHHIEFNTVVYTVEQVTWNGNPQPLRANDLVIWVKPDPSS